MILVDTNVVSEPLRLVPEPRVIQWLDAQALETLYISAVSVAELRSGVQTLPEGRRRELLHDNLEKVMIPRFAGRVLSFTLVESQAYAELMAKARSAGQAISVSDGFIAATAAANSMIVATRDTLPFETAGLATINPWTA